jgi:hypothetical protein
VNLEQTIQYCFDTYPTLFKERWQVLDQLFCVIGNGYEWKNGRLLYIGRGKIDVNCYTPILDVNGKAHNTNVRQNLFAWYRNDHYSDNNKYLLDMLKRIKDKKAREELRKSFIVTDEYIWNNVDKEIAGAKSNIRFYPVCEFSKIFTMPKNVKPDWLEGVKETVGLLLQYGFDYPGKKNEWQRSEIEKWTAELHKLAEKLEVVTV